MLQILTPHQFLATLRFLDPSNPTATEIQMRKRFLEFFPDQETNILKYQENPNCQCLNGLYLAISANNYLTLKTYASYILGQETDIAEPKQLAGTIEIATDDTHYGVIVQKHTKYGDLYKGISVVPTIIDNVSVLKLYFY